MTLGSQRLQRNISAGRIASLLSWNLATEYCSFTPWGSESWRTQSTSSTLRSACPCKLRSLGVDNAGGLFLDGFGRFRRCSQICQQTKDWFIPRKLLKRKALQNVVSEIRGYCVNCMCHFFLELGDLPLATHLGFAAWATTALNSGTPCHGEKERKLLDMIKDVIGTLNPSFNHDCPYSNGQRHPKTPLFVVSIWGWNQGSARELLARRWPSSLNHLLVVVLGELPPVPPAQRALEARISWDFIKKIDGTWWFNHQNIWI